MPYKLHSRNNRKSCFLLLQPSLLCPALLSYLSFFGHNVKKLMKHVPSTDHRPCSAFWVNAPRALRALLWERVAISHTSRSFSRPNCLEYRDSQSSRMSLLKSPHGNPQTTLWFVTVGVTSCLESCEARYWMIVLWCYAAALMRCLGLHIYISLSTCQCCYICFLTAKSVYKFTLLAVI